MSAMADLWLVKVSRGTYETVVWSGTHDECRRQAHALNIAFQTDEYFIERWEDQL